MIKNISEKVTCSLVDAGAVPPEDKALYEYGIRIGILIAINIVTALLIGLILGMLWQSILFLIVYSPVRSYSGGYHARSPLTCYLLSIPMMFAVLYAIKTMPWNGYILMASMFCALVLIVLLAPVADVNKPLDTKEKIKYRKKALIFSMVFFISAVILWFAELRQASFSIAAALVTAAALLTFGAAINHQKGINLE